jgi:hypothetical protein
VLGAEKRLGAGRSVDKTGANSPSKGSDMAAEINRQDSKDPNFPVHVRNYDSFLTLLKYAIAVVAIVAAVVLYVISH